jgi:hypothetical protein
LLRRALLLACALACLGAPAATAAQEPFSYLADPTDQLAIEGEVAGTEITPEGNLLTGWAELGFSTGGVAWDGRVRTLDGGRWPVQSARVERDGIVYTLTAFADRVDGMAVNFARLTALNPGVTPRPVSLAAALRWMGGVANPDGSRAFRFSRPVAFTALGAQWQPGEPFDPSASYTLAPGTVLRDGRVLLLHDAAATLRPDGPAALSPDSRGAEVATDGMLAPGAATQLLVRMPVVPIAADAPQLAAIRAASFDERRAALVARWRERLAPATILEVPEAKVQETFEASLVQILQSRYEQDGEWVQTVNKLSYHAFWLRDAAVMTHALDLVGLHDEARENLEFFARYQRPDGLFISRRGQLDGVGQAIWALAEHVRRADDPAFTKAALPQIDRAVTWIIRASNADRFNLVPASDPKDNEKVAGHLLGDQFWAVAGLESAAKMAAAQGDREREAAYAVERDVLRRRVREGIQRVSRRNGGTISPAVETADGRDWGNLWVAWPARVLAARDPFVGRTLAKARAGFREGIASYGPKRRLHSYIGFRVFQTELLRGEQERVIQGLYDTLAHTTSTHGAAELAAPAQSADRVEDNLAPHGWFSAEYVELLRNMLVREEGAGLDLFSAVAPGWIAPGRQVALCGAPTVHGPVSATLRGQPGGATLTWSARVARGVPLRWRLPAGASDVRVNGRAVRGTVVRLPARSGSLRVRWTLPPGPSYARVVAPLVRRAAAPRAGPG